MTYQTWNRARRRSFANEATRLGPLWICHSRPGAIWAPIVPKQLYQHLTTPTNGPRCDTCSTCIYAARQRVATSSIKAFESCSRTVCLTAKSVYGMKFNYQIQGTVLTSPRATPTSARQTRLSSTRPDGPSQRRLERGLEVLLLPYLARLCQWNSREPTIGNLVCNLMVSRHDKSLRRAILARMHSADSKTKTHSLSNMIVAGNREMRAK